MDSPQRHNHISKTDKHRKAKQTMGIQTEPLIVTIGILFLFGAAYATLINWLRRSGWLEGFTAFMVAFGVLVTLIANKAIHHPNPWIDLLLELSCFAASGLPMIIEASFLDFAYRRGHNEQHAIRQANSRANEVDHA